MHTHMQTNKQTHTHRHTSEHAHTHADKQATTHTCKDGAVLSSFSMLPEEACGTCALLNVFGMTECYTKLYYVVCVCVCGCMSKHLKECIRSAS